MSSGSNLSALAGLGGDAGLSTADVIDADVALLESR